MYSRAFGVRKALLSKHTTGRLYQHIGSVRMMNVSMQDQTGRTGSTSDTAPLVVGHTTTTQANTTEGIKGRRRRKSLPVRAPISKAAPRPWCRPLGEGVLPAYDLAVDLLKDDSTEIKVEVELLRTRIHLIEEERAEAVRQPGTNNLGVLNQFDENLEALRQKLRVLEVQSEVNLPNVRWRVANAMLDMSKAVDRHLLEQKWRKSGDLDLLMERIYQMKVIPDLLSEMHPSIDVRVTASTLGRVPDKAYQIVEPGTFLLPRQTFDPPKVYANVFHADTRLYTLILLDADVPDEVNASYTTYLHWMQPNIPLSAHHTSRILNLNNHTKYIPPHPQQGTGYHRYVLLLLQQPSLGGAKYSLNTEARAEPGKPTSVHLNIPTAQDKQRKGFHLRSFMRQWGFDMREGGGAHIWREVWDEQVSKIYQDTLVVPEPRYGHPKKPDPYSTLKNTKRYVS